MSNLNRLERVLISRRILFNKVSITPKGSFPKLKRKHSNIPIENDITNALSRGADVTLKRKLSHRCYEVVRPQLIHQALMYLKQKINIVL